ncbi:MAG TPA: SHOCT domain-containing protein [Dermatophilaceae bacterium]|nr:SHOCT domain-containing protein [Dermatophilaceae bacterium]
MGLLKTAGKVAVASHVHGRVQRRQQQRWAAEDAAAAPRTAPAPLAAPPQAAPAAPAVDGMLAQLTKLGDLQAAGVLTPAEFETQKARILAAG